MTEWYLIKPQPTFNSGFEKDEFTDYAQDGFDELLTETQLGKDILFCNGEFDGEYFKLERKAIGIVQSETPDAYTQGWKRQLLTRIGDSVKDYKYIKYDNKIWVIMTEPADNCIYDKCIIHQCNYVLKWQDDNGRVHFYPACIENASQYNTGEDGNKTVTLGYNQLMAYLSLDDITVLIKRDKRMFIDYNHVEPIPYKVTRPDTVCFSYGTSRVLSLIFTEDQFNPDTDSIEHWLCNYFPVADSKLVISYSGNATLRMGGSKTLTVDTTSAVIWNVDNPDITLIPDGNKVVIRCPNDENYIDTSIIITAIVDGSKAECELTIVGGV